MSKIIYFFRIYSLQDNGKTFLSLTELLNAMSPDFVEDLQETVKDGFTENGFSERLIDELVSATLTVNYGQSTKVHEFVGKYHILSISEENTQSVFKCWVAK